MEVSQWISKLKIFIQRCPEGYRVSQKLMVENDIRDRVKEALSRVIDSHKYVINRDGELLHSISSRIAPSSSKFLAMIADSLK